MNNKFNEAKEGIGQVISEIEKLNPELAHYLRKNIVMNETNSTFCYAPSNDRMSDERITDVPKTGSPGVLECT